jgi:hypothetical protein
MRMAFGLVSLLVVVAIILFVGSMYYPPMLTRGKQAQIQAQQIAGREGPGGPAVTQAVQWAEVREGGRFKGVQVAAIRDPSGALLKYYGLQVNDVVIEVNNLDFATVMMDSADAARDWVLTGYQNMQPITVLRNGQRIVLPQGSAPAGGAGRPAGAAPSIQRQLQGLGQQGSQQQQSTPAD